MKNKHKEISDITAMRFVNAIKALNPRDKRETMLYGTIVSVDPLAVKVDNLGGLVLPAECLIVGQWLRPVNVTIPHHHVINGQYVEKSPSLGNIGTGQIKGLAYEQINSAIDSTPNIQYETLNDKGEKQIETVSNKDLGRGSISTNIIVSGQATVVDDSVTIKDEQHKHFLPIHNTLDVHYPKQKFEDYVTLQISPPLAKDDIVLLFAFNDFQKFYIAERLVSGS